MASYYMKCESYKDLQTLILKQIPKPKNSEEKEQYQKEWVETTEKAQKLWGKLVDKNKKFYEHDKFLNIEYLSGKKQYRRKPLAKGRPTKQSIKERRITIRIDEETKGILMDYCQTSNVSESEAIRRAIMNLKYLR
jgi:hypothetical protein